MELKDRLKELRKEADLTQEELAKRLVVGKNTISNYETGYSSPDYPTLIKMADFFSVSVDYLLGRTDDPKGTIKINTIAAHSDNDLTEEEREKLREFAKFLKSQRK